MIISWISLLLVLAFAVRTARAPCAEATCSPCVKANCGWCLETAQCSEGNAAGPKTGSCQKWVSNKSLCTATPVPTTAAPTTATSTTATSTTATFTTATFTTATPTTAAPTTPVPTTPAPLASTSAPSLAPTTLVTSSPTCQPPTSSLSTLVVMNVSIASHRQLDGMSSGSTVSFEDVQGPLNLTFIARVDGQTSAGGDVVTASLDNVNASVKYAATWTTIRFITHRVEMTIPVVRADVAASSTMLRLIANVNESVLGEYAAAHADEPLILWNTTAIIHLLITRASSSTSLCSLLPSLSITSTATFGLTILGHPSLAPIVVDSTLAASQAAVAVSVAAGVVSGPGSASDLQAMFVVTLARCSASSDAAVVAPGGYKLLTPFSLSDTARGALAGNAVALSALLVAQGVYFGIKKYFTGASTVSAASAARLPGFSLLMTSSLHQSTLFSSIRLMGSDGSGTLDLFMGLLAFSFSIALPIGVVFAAAKVPRRFVDYSVEPSSSFARVPWKFIVPIGAVLPSDVRFLLGSVITSSTFAGYMYPAIFFVSSFVTNIVAALPASSPASLCSGAMFASAMVHLGLAAFIAVVGVYRFPTSRLLNASGLLLICVFHAQIAVGWRQGIDSVLTLQAGLSIFRSVVALGNTITERRMKQSEAVSQTEVRWLIGGCGFGDRGAADVEGKAAHLAPAVPLLSSPPDVNLKQLEVEVTSTLVDDSVLRLSPLEPPEPERSTEDCTHPLTTPDIFHPSLGETASVKPFDFLGNEMNDILRSYEVRGVAPSASQNAKGDEDDDDL